MNPLRQTQESKIVILAALVPTLHYRKVTEVGRGLPLCKKDNLKTRLSWEREHEDIGLLYFLIYHSWDFSELLKTEQDT